MRPRIPHHLGLFCQVLFLNRFPVPAFFPSTCLARRFRSSRGPGARSLRLKRGMLFVRGGIFGVERRFGRCVV